MTELSGISVSPKAVPANQQFAPLRKACQDFESLMLRQMLKSMRSTVQQNGLLGESHSGDIVQGMFDDNLAQVMADKNGIGIADILFERLKDRM